MEPKGTFGPRLRQERERRQISLDSIAANTKISRSLLEALERDDVGRWPSGIFRRAFLRSYATAIGMDAEEIWREFAERFPDPHPPVAAAAEVVARTDDSHDAPVRPKGDISTAAPPVRRNAKRYAGSLKMESTRADRVELVFRVSVPRSWVNLALWVKSLASRGPAIPRRQNQNS